MDEAVDGARDDDWREPVEDLPRASWWKRLRTRGARLDGRLDGVERPFLALLRATALVVAALLILASIILLLLGFGLQVQRPDSVSAEPVSIEAADLAAPAAPQASPAPAGGAQLERWARVLPAEFRTAYYQLYRQAFVPSYRATEKPLEQAPFFQELFPDDVLDTIESFNDERLAAASAGDGAADRQSQMRPVLASLLSAVQGAAGQEAVRRELLAYKAAQRVQVCRNVQRTRTRSVERWDSLSTNCPYWFEPPYGCMGRQELREPYQERVCSMQFPDQLANPAQVMRDLQSRYFLAANDKIAISERDAELQRREIADRNAFGSNAVWYAILAFGSFLSVMFLYLLVALERHHRALSRRLAPPEISQPT
jgi:hypothetical protein